MVWAHRRLRTINKMINTRHLSRLTRVLVIAVLASLATLYAQADIQSAVTAFLQAWYVDKKSPTELKSFVAKDNAFNLQQQKSAAKGRSSAQVADPLTQLFRGAFSQPKRGERAAPPPKTLSDAIEYPPAKAPGERTMNTSGAIITDDLAIYRADSQQAKSFLPAKKPSGSDPVANYLYHLTQAYKGKLYVATYAVKGAGMLHETAVTYWIREDGAWKLSAFVGTNW
jgi:hypothetical protein